MSRKGHVHHKRKRGIPDVAEFPHEYSEDMFPLDEASYLDIPKKKKKRDPKSGADAGGAGDGDGGVDGADPEDNAADEGDGDGDGGDEGEDAAPPTATSPHKDFMEDTAFSKDSALRGAVDLLGYTNPFSGTILFGLELAEAIEDHDTTAVVVASLSWVFSFFGFGSAFIRSGVAHGVETAAVKVIGAEATEAVASTVAKAAGKVGSVAEKMGLRVAEKMTVNVTKKIASKIAAPISKLISVMKPGFEKATKYLAPLGDALSKFKKPLANVSTAVERWQAKKFPNVFKRMRAAERSGYAAIAAAEESLITERTVEESLGGSAANLIDDAQTIRNQARVIRTQGTALDIEINTMKQSIEEDVARLHESFYSARGGGSTASYTVRRGGSTSQMNFINEVDKLLQGKIAENPNTMRFLETIGIDVKDIKYAELSNRKSMIRNAMYKKFDAMLSTAREIEQQALVAAESAAEFTGSYVQLTEPLTESGRLVRLIEKLQTSRGLSNDDRAYSIFFSKLVLTQMSHMIDNLQKKHESKNKPMNRQLGDDYFTN